MAASPLLPGQNSDLDELLTLNLTDLLELQVVSPLKVPQTINRVPASVRVITADQIRQRGYFTLEDALADLPGFQFRNIAGFNSYVFMRGIPSQNNKILVLMDGVQINELNSGGFYGGGQYNLAAVERIEVVYGPASALYGTNAVSGIVNIITADPRDADGGRVSALAGNYDTRLADFRIGSRDPDRDLGFTLSGMFKTSDKADLGGREGDGNWTDAMDNFEEDLALDGRFRYGDLTAGFNLQDKDASRATVQRTADGTLSDHDVNWHIRFLNVWAAYDYHEQETWSLRTTAYFRDSTVLDDTVPVIELSSGDDPGSQYRYYRPNHLIGSETQVHWTPATRWRFSLGLVLERERLAEDFSVTQSGSAGERPPAPPKPGMMTNDLVSLFAQATTALTGSLDLFIGLRHDDSSYYGTVDTPRLGLVVNRGRLTVKALFGEAFRAPRPWDYTNGTGNPDLEPETMRSWEASAAWSFSPSLRLDAGIYRNRLEGLLARSTHGEEWHWVNAGRLDTDGGEIALEYRRGALRAYANYSITDSRDEEGNAVPEIARHMANAGAAYSVTPALTVDLRLHYLGARDNPSVIPATGDDHIDDALLLNAAFSLKLPRGFFFHLAVDNLTDALYFHPSNLPPSRYRQPQRSFRLQAAYAF